MVQLASDTSHVAALSSMCITECQHGENDSIAYAVPEDDATIYRAEVHDLLTVL